MGQAPGGRVKGPGGGEGIPEEFQGVKGVSGDSDFQAPVGSKILQLLPLPNNATRQLEAPGDAKVCWGFFCWQSTLRRWCLAFAGKYARWQEVTSSGPLPNAEPGRMGGERVAGT